MNRNRPHLPEITELENLAEEILGEAGMRSMAPRDRVPRVRGTRTITAMLPSGRVAWLRVSPPPASASEINRLRGAVQRAEVRQAARLRSNARALRNLSQRVSADYNKLGKRRVAADRKLIRKSMRGNEKIGRRFARGVGRLRKVTTQGQSLERTIVQRQGRRHLWDSIVLTSAAPLYAAYGQKENPLAEHNLVLTLSLAVWLLGDELTDLLSPGRAARAAEFREVDFWSSIAPVGNVLTAWWLFNDRQHERFVSGVAVEFPQFERQNVQNVISLDHNDEIGIGEVIAIDEPTAIYLFQAQIDLAPYIAEGHIDDFRTFSEVRVVATLVADGWSEVVAEAGLQFEDVRALVDRGYLFLTVVARGPLSVPNLTNLPHPHVAWVVDTKDPGDE